MVQHGGGGRNVEVRPSKSIVRKIIMENRATPKDLKLPGLNLDESVLEIEVSTIDMVAAAEAVATSKERGGVERITLLASSSKNGPLHIFFRRKVMACGCRLHLQGTLALRSHYRTRQRRHSGLKF